MQIYENRFHRLDAYSRGNYEPNYLNFAGELFWVGCDDPTSDSDDSEKPSTGQRSRRWLVGSVLGVSLAIGLTLIWCI